MTMLYIVAEGQTEETFIEELLRPLLADSGVILMGTLVMDGNVRYGRLKSMVVKLLKQHPTAFCTTFIDYYGRGDVFPIDAIRSSCPLFDSWVTRLVDLSK